MDCLSFAISTIIFFTTVIPRDRISAVGYPLNVWPKPTQTQWSRPQAIFLSRQFTISASNHAYLTPAALRYRTQVLNEHHYPLVPPNLSLTASSARLSALKITVSHAAAALAHGVDESYSLQVPCNGSQATMRAKTPWGAMRGLETFSQLVYSNPPRVGCGLTIRDAPLFPHRGVVLDTSRNFYGVEDLLRLIGAIGMNKLNVFHWHITDSHSFPLVLKSEPNLAAKGAYGDDMKYTAADVEKVVRFGMECGVRVLPEIDMPAHTLSWADAHPEIITCANQFWLPAGSDWADRFASEPGAGQLNPLHPKTYNVVKNVVRDVVSMFPDQFYHAGGDEVTPNCWKNDSSIHDFLSKKGTLSQVLEKFIKITLPYIVALNRTVVYWEDVLLDVNINVRRSQLPPKNVILQTWNGGPNNTKKIVQAGYRVIVSSSDFYYLDCGHGEFTGNNKEYDQPPGTDQGNGGSWCGPFKTWQLIYNYDITYGLSKEESKLVIGGEAALWSEQADSTVMDSRIWPRTSAMAEVLWSGNRDEQGKKRSGEATDRLIEWRQRMVNRKIGAEPLQPLWCIKHKGKCDNTNAAA